MKYLLSCLVLAASLLGAPWYVQAADTEKKAAAKAPASTSKDADTKESSTKETAPALLPRVRIQTNFGDMMVELYDDKAPKTVENFLSYVREGTYDGTIFHRVISDFMIQGGAYDSTYKARYVHAPIPNEAKNGLKNERGTLAMARDYDPHSATNQFFINVANNRILNHHSPKAGHWGYTVFGRVTEGLDVLDRLRNFPTGAGGPFIKDVPKTQAIIKKISIETAAPPFMIANAKAVEKKDTKTAAKKDTKKTAKAPAKKTVKTKAPDKQASATDIKTNSTTLP